MDKNLEIRALNRRVTELLVTIDALKVQVKESQSKINNAQKVIEDKGFVSYDFDGETECPIFITEKDRVLEYINWELE